MKILEIVLATKEIEIDSDENDCILKNDIIILLNEKDYGKIDFAGYYNFGRLKYIGNAHQQAWDESGYPKFSHIHVGYK